MFRKMSINAGGNADESNNRDLGKIFLRFSQMENEVVFKMNPNQFPWLRSRVENMSCFWLE